MDEVHGLALAQVRIVGIKLELPDADHAHLGADFRADFMKVSIS
jgi:hypothetical protein